MENMQVIEPIINSFKVRYDVFTDLIRKSNMEGNHIAMYINVDSILDKFYTSNEIISAMNSLKHEESIILTSELINIVAHYRHFFWSRFRAPSVFYFYYCSKRPKWQSEKNKDYMSILDFKRDLENPKFGGLNETLESNLKLVDLLSTYVNHAYFIKSDGLEPSVIPYFLIKKTLKKNTDICHMILTNDKSEYQLANLPNTFILRSRGEKSKIIDSSMIYDHKFKDIKYRPENKLSPELYPLLLAFLGYKPRSLPKVKGYTLVATLKLLDKLIDNKVIKNGNNKGLDKEAFLNYISEEQFDQLEKNYKCINFNRAYKLLRDVDIIKIDKALVDKYDNMSIMNLNTQYFQGNNIMLVELCEGTV